jgi:hypothetical protein
MAEQTQHGPLLDAFNEILGVRPTLKCVMGREPEKPPGRDAAGAEGSFQAPEDLSDEGSGEPAPDAIEMIRRAFNASVVSEEP